MLLLLFLGYALLGLTGIKPKMPIPMKHCIVCGYEERCYHLVDYCSKCEVAMVHRYCKDGPLKKGGEVIWLCEDCSPRTMKNLAASQYVKDNEPIPNETHDDLLGQDNKLWSVLDRKQSFERHGDPGDPNQGYAIDKSSKLKDNQPPIDKELVQNIVDIPPLIKTTSTGVASHFVNDKSWRGICEISQVTELMMSCELEAHLSTSAASNVAKVAHILPTRLDLQVVHKSNNFPKRFSEVQPSCEDIALYFFPVHESDEKQCGGLIDKMMNEDLILKFTMNDLKLLLFTSFDLPNEMWSYNGKCYLWGVFVAPTISAGAFAPTSQVKMPPRLPSSNINNRNAGVAKKDECIKVSIVYALPAYPPSTLKKYKQGGRIRQTMIERHHHLYQVNGKRKRQRRSGV